MFKKAAMLVAVGLLFTARPSSAVSLCDGIAGNLVSNCGFETGDFTAWGQSGNLGFSGIDNTVWLNTGSYGSYWGPIGSDGYLTQTLGTANGGVYDLQFWIENLEGTPNHFSASWNGTEVYGFTDAGAFGYTFVDIPGLIGVGSDVLQFAFRQDPSFMGFDDVSVTGGLAEVPEPSTLLLLGSGLVFAANRMRKRTA